MIADTRLERAVAELAGTVAIGQRWEYRDDAYFFRGVVKSIATDYAAREIATFENDQWHYTAQMLPPRWRRRW